MPALLLNSLPWLFDASSAAVLWALIPVVATVGLLRRTGRPARDTELCPLARWRLSRPSALHTA